MFCSQFGAAVTKIFNKYKEISLVKFLETLNLFSRPKLSGKKRGQIIFTLPVTPCDLSNFGKTLLFSENCDWENKFKVSKNIFWEISFCIVENLCNRNPKKRKTFKNYIWLDASLLKFLASAWEYTERECRMLAINYFKHC